jgi:hypothetical protein
LFDFLIFKKCKLVRMKKHFLQVMLLLCLNSYAGMAQQISAEAHAYFNAVYAAEKHLVQRQYDSACVLYNNIAASYPANASVTDLYNAFAVNLACRQVPGAKKILVLLSRRNISVKKLLANPSLDSLIRLNESLLTDALVKKLIQKTVSNRQHRRVLDSLFERDQFIRRQKDAYTALLGDMERTDAGNARILYEMILQHGIFDEDELLYGERDKAMTKTQLLILHQNRWHTLDFTPLLLKAVNKLQMRPSVASFLIDGYRQSNRYMSAALFRIHAKNDTCHAESPGWLRQNMDAAALTRLDTVRKEMALEPYSDYLAKAIFSTTDTIFIWQNSFAKATYNMSSCAQAKALLESGAYKPIY